MTDQPTTQRLRLRLYNARLDFNTEQTEQMLRGPWHADPAQLLASGWSNESVTQIMDMERTARIDEMLVQQRWRMERTTDRQRSTSGSEIQRSPLKRIDRSL